MMKKIFFSSLLVIFVAGLAPDVVFAADGCSSVGPTCTINGNVGTCAQNDIGVFYCRPSVLDQPVSGFTALAPIPGLTDPSSTSVVNQGSFANFFNNLYKYLIGLAAVLAVIMIIWGGLEISTKDSVSKQSDGKARIYNAIFGLVLVLSPVLVFSIINPSILNLSINLPKLDTTSRTVSPVSTGMTPIQSQQVEAATTAASAAGCTVTGTLMKTAICPTQQAANDFAAACPNDLGDVPFFTTDHKATCGVGGVGPYSFADTSSGIIATITGYSKYQPLKSTPSNPSNGADVIQFASSCTSDGGTTCMSARKLPCASSVVQLLTTGSSASCWNISLSCTNNSVGVGGCSDSPEFTAVQTQ